jgi:hypothetical protein
MRKRIADWLEKMSVGMFIGGMLNPTPATPQVVCYFLGVAFFIVSMVLTWQEGRKA